jgi:hypothetical protein
VPWRHVLVVALAAAALMASPGSAHAATATSVTMFSDGDYIGGGETRLFTPGSASISVFGSTAYLTVSVSGGPSGDSYAMDFAAPPGQTLVPGVYDKAQRAPFREAGRPGIDIYGDGRGCNTISGRFEVKDFAVSSTGVLQRLWIVYEQHCEGGPAALFGEVRITEPIPDGPAATAPGLVRWPPAEPGATGAAVPVTLVAASPVQIAGAAVAGADAAAFPIRLDECSGRSLGVGDSCEVWVRFSGANPGTRAATLRITDTAGRAYDTALQGFAWGGTTKLDMTGDPGDYIGAGQRWVYTPATAVIAAAGSRQHAGFGIDGNNGDWWYGDFSPAQGDILAPGTYTGAARDAFRGSSPGLDVSGNGRGCNEITGRFTVTEITFDSSGALRTFGVNFEQHCEGATPALRGVFDYRAGDTTPLPPWMVSGPGSTGPVATLGGAGGGAPSTPAPTAPTGAPSSPPAAHPTPTFASACADRTFVRASIRRGTRRADRLRGSRRGDLLLGRAGADRLTGGAGADCLAGGNGRDRLAGGSGADVLAGDSGADRLLGGRGRDVLIAGSGRDRLDCGPGRDVAVAQRGDKVRRCEKVIRPGSTARAAAVRGAPVRYPG